MHTMRKRKAKLKAEGTRIMKRYRMYVVFTAMIGLLAFLGAAMAGETKFATGTSSAALTFAAGNGQTKVGGLYATSDKEDAAVKFYSWNQVATLMPTTAPASGATTVAVANASYALTNDDVVVYQHVTGTAVYRSISSATATTVVLNAALTEAGSTSDRIFELTQGGQITVGYDGTTVGASDGLAVGGTVYTTPGGSPLYMVLDGTSNAVLQATIDQ
jgi:hypothetical protein